VLAERRRYVEEVLLHIEHRVVVKQAGSFTCCRRKGMQAPTKSSTSGREGRERRRLRRNVSEGKDSRPRKRVFPHRKRKHSRAYASWNVLSWGHIYQEIILTHRIHSRAFGNLKEESVPGIYSGGGPSLKRDLGWAGTI